jgi:hypothetical protein
MTEHFPPIHPFLSYIIATWMNRSSHLLTRFISLASPTTTPRSVVVVSLSPLQCQRPFSTSFTQFAKKKMRM